LPNFSNITSVMRVYSSKSNPFSC